MQTTDTQQTIKDKLDDQNVRIACIGPAGEKLARLACIVNERRVAGRKGLGAVMGSKNLKAIAVRGDSAAGDRRPGDVQGGAQAHARRHEGQPRAVLRVRPLRHRRATSTTAPRSASSRPRTSRRPAPRSSPRRSAWTPWRRAAPARPPAPSARWPAASCASRRRRRTPACSPRGPSTRRSTPSAASPASTTRTPSSAADRLADEFGLDTHLGRRRHRLRHGAVRARHPDRRRHRRPGPALRQSTRPWSSCCA